MLLSCNKTIKYIKNTLSRLKKKKIAYNFYINIVPKLIIRSKKPKQISKILRETFKICLFFFKCKHYLFTILTYCSKAMVIEGATGNGAGISKINPASKTALCVDTPNAAIRVLFCLKSGKFLYNDCMLEGLKKAITS